MVVLTRSSKPAPNARARASVLLGLLAIAAVPAAVLVARFDQRVTLIHAGIAGTPLGGALAIAAIMLARRGQQLVERTIGRIGGAGVARLGRLLGVAGLCLAAAAGIALGFYGLLALFAS